MKTTKDLIAVAAMLIPTLALWYALATALQTYVVPFSTALALAIFVPTSIVVGVALGRVAGAVRNWLD